MTFRIATAVAILIALASPTYADGTYRGPSDTDVKGVLLVLGAIVVGIVFFAFIVGGTKRAERKMAKKFAPKPAAKSDLPAARVVKRTE